MKFNIQVIRFLFLLILPVVVSACSSTKCLEEHKTSIQTLAQSDLPPNDKFDMLAEELSAMLNKASQIPNADKSMAFMSQYYWQNKTAIEQLIKELDEYQQNMKNEERMTFASALVSHSSLVDMKAVLPKIRKKLGPSIEGLDYYRDLLFVYQLSL